MLLCRNSNALIPRTLDLDIDLRENSEPILDRAEVDLVASDYVARPENIEADGRRRNRWHGERG